MFGGLLERAYYRVVCRCERDSMALVGIYSATYNLIGN